MSRVYGTRIDRDADIGGSDNTVETPFTTLSWMTMDEAWKDKLPHMSVKDIVASVVMERGHVLTRNDRPRRLRLFAQETRDNMRRIQQIEGPTPEELAMERIDAASEQEARRRGQTIVRAAELETRGEQ